MPKTNPTSPSSNQHYRHVPRNRGRWKNPNNGINHNVRGVKQSGLSTEEKVDLVISLIVIVVSSIFIALLKLNTLSKPNYKPTYNQPRPSFYRQAPEYGSFKSDSFNQRRANNQKRTDEKQYTNPTQTTSPTEEVADKKYLEKRITLITTLELLSDVKSQYELAEKIMNEDLENGLFSKAFEIINSKYFDPAKKKEALENLESIKNVRNTFKQEKVKPQSSETVIQRNKPSKYDYDQAVRDFNGPTKDYKSLKEFFNKEAIRLHPDKVGSDEEFKKLKNAFDIIKDYNNW